MSTLDRGAGHGHGPDGDETDGKFLQKARQTLRPKHLIREEQDVAALMNASKTLKEENNTGELSSPARQEAYSTFIDADEGCAERLSPGTFQKADVRRLISQLTDWIAEALLLRRVIVRDIFGDLYDGVVLDELLDALTGVPETAKKTVGGTRGKEHILQVLERIHELLGLDSDTVQWSPARIYGKEVVATLHLVVALIHHFKPEIVLPDHVVVDVLIVRNTKDKMQQAVRHEQITSNERARVAAAQLAHAASKQPSRHMDTFDKLFEQAPDKVETVKHSLVQFGNKHLSRLAWNTSAAATGEEPPINDIIMDLQDGVLLLHLLSVLGQYFIPICEYHPKPVSHFQKLANMGLVFQLMASQGIPISGVPDDVVNGDLKMTLRLMYAIFSEYKTVSVPAARTNVTSGV